MARPTSNPYAAFLTQAARTLLEAAPDRYIRSQVLGFVGYLCRERRALVLASQKDLLAYRDELIAAGVQRPKQVVRDTAHAWNRMAELPGWPKIKLVPPSSARTSLAYKDLPSDLKADCDRYFADNSDQHDEDLFSPDAKKPLAPATLKDRRGKVCQLVVHYVGGGGKLSDLRTLCDLTEEKACGMILSRIWRKNDKQANAHGANLARLLFLIAKHHCQAPQSVLDLIRNAEAKFRPKKAGMTARNRAKLRTILEDRALPRLLRLPQLFMAGLDPSRPTLSDAIGLQSALAIAIELVAPMRAKNLAALDSQKHFDMVSDTQCHIVIDAGEVKNTQDLNYVLGSSFIKIFKLYLEVYHPLLRGRGKSSSLFISRYGSTKSPAALGAQVQVFIKEQTGIRLNIHLFRHLTGYIYLRHYPGQYEPVRQLLGHKDVRTTISFYVGLEEDASFKRYGEILDRLIASEEDDCDV
jgi:integrase